MPPRPLPPPDPERGPPGRKHDGQAGDRNRWAVQHPHGVGGGRRAQAEHDGRRRPLPSGQQGAAGNQAERVALLKALSEGKRNFKKITVVTDAKLLTPPCGSCRQMLWEFCGNIEVELVKAKAPNER